MVVKGLLVRLVGVKSYLHDPKIGEGFDVCCCGWPWKSLPLVDGFVNNHPGMASTALYMKAASLEAVIAAIGLVYGVHG